MWFHHRAKAMPAAPAQLTGVSEPGTGTAWVLCTSEAIAIFICVPFLFEPHFSAMEYLDLSPAFTSRWEISQCSVPHPWVGCGVSRAGADSVSCSSCPCCPARGCAPGGAEFAALPLLPFPLQPQVSYPQCAQELLPAESGFFCAESKKMGLCLCK